MGYCPDIRNGTAAPADLLCGCPPATVVTHSQIHQFTSVIAAGVVHFTDYINFSFQDLCWRALMTDCCAHIV